MKYKSIVEMQGVQLNPAYRKTKFSAINYAKVIIREAQRIQFSYNVSAIIRIFEKIDNVWVEIEEHKVEPLEAS